MLPAATTTTASWWWVAALAGVFTVLGALVSLFSNWIVKRGELRRLDRVRWDDTILTISVALLDLADRLSKEFDHSNQEAAGQAAFFQKYGVELEAATQQVKGLDLIAPQDLCDAASGLTDAIREFLVGLATDPEHARAMPVWNARYKLRNEARKTLHAID